MAFSTSAETEHQQLTRGVWWIVVASASTALLQATVVTPADMAAWLGLGATGLTHAWWTLATYAFVQVGVWPLVVTLFALLIFGPRVEQVWGTRAFVVFFLWCILGGALLHATFARGGTLEGAASGVFGVMLAYGWLFPKDELYLFGVLPVRVWTLIMALTVVILAVGVSEPTGSGVGYLAHLGGFAFAALYLKRPNPVSIEELRQRVAPAPDLTDETPRAIPRTLPRARRGDEVDEVVAQSKAAVAKRPVRTIRGSMGRDAKREALNRVLDKISEQGLDSLTSEDRTLLEEMSRRLRGR
jgi:rhomboid family protein